MCGSACVLHTVSPDLGAAAHPSLLPLRFPLNEMGCASVPSLHLIAFPFFSFTLMVVWLMVSQVGVSPSLYYLLLPLPSLYHCGDDSLHFLMYFTIYKAI